jgi:hypothetical protein
MPLGFGRKKPEAVQINQQAVKGEPGTGYEGPEYGPFSCSTCEYFKDNSCGQKDFMEKSKRPKTPEGRVKVEAEGCCVYHEAIEKEK